MQYRRVEDTIILRLDPGEEIAASVLEVAGKEQIGCASVTGIGATNDATVGVFDLSRKVYDKCDIKGDREITNLSGSLTVMDGKPYQHLHITLAGPGGTVSGGHLFRAVISLTCEIFITVVPTAVERKYAPAIGINTIQP